MIMLQEFFGESKPNWLFNFFWGMFTLIQSISEQDQEHACQQQKKLISQVLSDKFTNLEVMYNLKISIEDFY